MENILIALGGALFSAACGGFVGHKLTVKLFRERSALQKKAFWCEFDLILITRLKTVLLKIQKTSQERDAVIEEWFKTENKATTFNPIRFYTAQMLLDTIQVVFYSVTVRPSHLEPMCS